MPPGGRGASMTRLIEHLADLTGSRDRDQLDVAVVRAISDVLRPSLVAIHRVVGEADDRRWLTRVQLDPGDAVPQADPQSVDLEHLPRLADFASRLACLETVRTVVDGSAPQIHHFPICTERDVSGVLELRTAAPMADAERALVSTVLRLFGNVLDLLDHSERDALTGLLNRQSFNATLLARMARRSLRELGDNDRRSQPGPAMHWIGVVDIDFFKRVNDGFGHPIGDEVLLLLSRLLRSTFRHFDLLYRFGGEEFVVVLECADAAHAAAAFERLRSRVETFAFPQVGRVTISTGFTSMHALEEPAVAVARADKALYHVKQNGRNQVAQYEVLVESGQLVETQIVGDVELF